MIMLRSKLVAIYLVVGLAMTGIARQASAKPVMTPFGLADDSCVHETPKGAAIDAATGNVWLNNQIIDHFETCTVSVDPGVQPGGGSPPGNGGWYEWSSAQAVPIGSVKQFNYGLFTWTVPTNPNVSPSDTALEYYFPGLSNYVQGGTCPSNNVFLQPVLQWGSG